MADYPEKTSFTVYVDDAPGVVAAITAEVERIDAEHGNDVPEDQPSPIFGAGTVGSFEIEVEGDDHLWVGGDSVDVNTLAALCSWLRGQPGAPDVIEFTWAATCSKLEPDSFGGGACKVDRWGVRFMHTGSTPQQLLEYAIDPIEDSESGVTYEPYTDGTVLGWRAHRSDEGRGFPEFLYLNPTDYADDGVANVFVYQGTEGDPASDEAVTHFVMVERDDPDPDPPEDADLERMADTAFHHRTRQDDAMRMAGGLKPREERP